MSANLIQRIVEVVIGVFFIGAFLQIGRATAAIFEGSFGTLHWPIQAGAYGLDAAVGESATAVFNDASLAVSGQPFWHAIDLLFSLSIIGIYIMVLMLLRKVLTSFAKGDLVTADNAAALRRIGLVLLGACAISLVHAVVLQSAILGAVEPVAGTVLHPSISWDVSGATNIWLHYSPPIGTFLLAGLALLFGEAMRAGADYRQDSESVV